MFAAHDQENLVSIHQTAANNKQLNQNNGARALQPKTPGARYPKTPLKIPLNDENVVRGFGGGKSVLAGKTNGDKSQWVTPAGEHLFFSAKQVNNMDTHRNCAEPRTGRAVLGDKTTNAKARNNPPTNGKNTAARDLQKSQLRPNTASRQRSQALKTESTKLQILLDQSDPLNEEIDTNAPPPPALPYKSDVFPDGILTFDAIRPENRMKGYYEYYHNRRDENGMTRLDREMQSMQEERFKTTDAQIRKDLDDIVWDLGLDSPKKSDPAPTPAPAADAVIKRVARPGATSKAPSTLNSKRAASALGVASKPPVTNLQRKPLAAKPTAANTGKLPSFMQPTKATQASTSTLATRLKIPSSATNNTGVAASRNTLGYSKGRNASSAVRVGVPFRSVSDAPSRVLARSNTTASGSSDTTVMPAGYVEDNAMPKPEFVSIFDVALSGQVDGTNAQLSGSMDDSGTSCTDGAVDPLAGIEDDDDFQLELSL